MSDLSSRIKIRLSVSCGLSAPQCELHTILVRIVLSQSLKPLHGLFHELLIKIVR